MDTRETVKLLLILIPYIKMKGGRINEKELKENFDLDRPRLRKIFDLIMLIGYPPYTPDLFFDLYVDEDDPEKICLHTPFENILSSPVRFSIQEAFALITGYRLLAKSLQMEQLNRIVDKIKHSLLKARQPELHNLERTIDFNIPVQGFNDKIDIINAALSKNRLIKMQYYAASSDSTSIRIVEPYLTVNHHGRWYFIAFCRKHQDYRSFRFDRIKKIELLDDIFPPRQDFEPLKYTEADNFYFETGEPAEFAELRFKKDAIKNVLQEFYNAHIRTLPSGDAIVRLPLRNEAWLLSILRKFGDDVIIVSPDNLKKRLVTGYEKLLKLYK